MMERKPKVGKEKGDTMPECVSCRHGNKCPYTEESDLFHELLESAAANVRLHERAGNLMARIESDIRRRSKIKIGFDVDYHVVNCEKFEQEGECPELRKN